jgi:hypothetical protein
MRLTSFRSISFALAAVAMIACNGDNATGVSAVPAAAKVAPGTAIQTTSIRRLAPLATDVTASAVIGSAGGSFTVPGTGLVVSVAKGAVSAPTTFSATAYAGSTIGYDFAPHQAFAAAITLTQDFKNTNVKDVLAAGNMPQVAYFADKSLVNWSTGDATVSEMVFSNVDVNGGKVSADVYHFSGYLMSSGRR